jgi:hypothetical protein
MKSFGFSYSKIIFPLQNITHQSCTVVDNLIAGFPKEKVHVSLIGTISAMFDMADVFTAVGKHALGRTVAQVILLYLFVVMSENVRDGTK